MRHTVGTLVVLAIALLVSGVRGADMSLAKDDVGQIWLQIIGRIDAGDDVKFRALLVDAINRGDQIARVSVYSAGGQPGTAMAIGRYVRDLHLATVAPRLMPLLGRQTCDVYAVAAGATVLEYDPLRQRGDARCACSGACVLVWAAGAIRHGDAVQIQRADPAQDVDHEVPAAYLRDMGIPEDTISRMSVPASDKIGYLTIAERGMLANGAAIPLLRDLYAARCSRHAATSPAALACEKAVVRDLYWAGARRLLGGND
jgi:hypothetical protein